MQRKTIPSSVPRIINQYNYPKVGPSIPYPYYNHTHSRSISTNSITTLLSLRYSNAIQYFQSKIIFLQFFYQHYYTKSLFSSKLLSVLLLRSSSIQSSSISKSTIYLSPSSNHYPLLLPSTINHQPPIIGTPLVTSSLLFTSSSSTKMSNSPNNTQNSLTFSSKTMNNHSSNSSSSSSLSSHSTNSPSSIPPLSQSSSTYVPDRYLTVPNLMTVLRMILAPYVGYCILYDQYQIAFYTALFAGILDGLDGWVARTWKNQASIIGSYLDPLADKLLITIATICLGYQNILSPYLVFLIIGRDILLIIGGLYLRYTTKPSHVSFFSTSHISTLAVEPTTLSKYNTLLQIFLICLSITSVGWNFPGDKDNVYIQILSILVAGTTFFSGLGYWRNHGYKIVHPIHKNNKQRFTHPNTASSSTPTTNTTNGSTNIPKSTTNKQE